MPRSVGVQEAVFLPAHPQTDKPNLKLARFSFAKMVQTIMPTIIAIVGVIASYHKGTASVEQIQLSLGHSSLQTTERYLGIQQDLTSAPCDMLGLK